VLDGILVQAGIGARRARLSAFVAGLDADRERFGIDCAEVDRKRAEHVANGHIRSFPHILTVGFIVEHAKGVEVKGGGAYLAACRSAAAGL